MSLPKPTTLLFKPVGTPFKVGSAFKFSELIFVENQGKIFTLVFFSLLPAAFKGLVVGAGSQQKNLENLFYKTFSALSFLWFANLLRLALFSEQKPLRHLILAAPFYQGVNLQQLV